MSILLNIGINIDEFAWLLGSMIGTEAKISLTLILLIHHYFCVPFTRGHLATVWRIDTVVLGTTHNRHEVTFRQINV